MNESIVFCDNFCLYAKDHTEMLKIFYSGVLLQSGKEFFLYNERANRSFFGNFNKDRLIQKSLTEAAQLSHIFYDQLNSYQCVACSDEVFAWLFAYNPRSIDKVQTARVIPEIKTNNMIEGCVEVLLASGIRIFVFNFSVLDHRSYHRVIRLNEETLKTESEFELKF